MHVFRFSVFLHEIKSTMTWDQRLTCFLFLHVTEGTLCRSLCPCKEHSKITNGKVCHFSIITEQHSAESWNGDAGHYHILFLLTAKTSNDHVGSFFFNPWADVPFPTAKDVRLHWFSKETSGNYLFFKGRPWNYKKSATRSNVRCQIFGAFTFSYL